MEESLDSLITEIIVNETNSNTFKKLKEQIDIYQRKGYDVMTYKIIFE